MTRYAAEGLTIEWFDRRVDTSRFADWWGGNPRGKMGSSYCIVNALNPARIAAPIAAMTTQAHEILSFSDDKSMKELIPLCKFNRVQRISDDTHQTDPTYCPKVSVVMSTFKRQHIILRTVEFLRRQDYQNWELIIIDNERGGRGLPPMPADHRITTHNLIVEANGCYSRNEGVKLATGDIVGYFDDDDEMLPGFISKMVAPFCDPEVQIVRCGMLLTNNSCDFSYSTQEAWLRREYATATWKKGTPVHDQIYFNDIINLNGWSRRNIVQLGEILIKAHTEPIGGRRSVGAED